MTEKSEESNNEDENEGDVSLYRKLDQLREEAEVQAMMENIVSGKWRKKQKQTDLRNEIIELFDEYGQKNRDSQSESDGNDNSNEKRRRRRKRKKKSKKDLDSEWIINEKNTNLQRKNSHIITFSFIHFYSYSTHTLNAH
jgi:hypothetical protein